MKKVKYVGASDRHILSVGENWGGRLPEPLSEEVVFDKDFGFLAEVDDPVAQLLLEDPNFLDVTNAEVIPTGLNERVYRAAPETPFVSRADGQGNEVFRSPVPEDTRTADQLKAAIPSPEHLNDPNLQAPKSPAKNK